MLVRALVSFAGTKVSMYQGQVQEVADDEFLQDLLRAKYVEPIEVVEAEVKEVKKTAKKAAKKR